MITTKIFKIESKSGSEYVADSDWFLEITDSNIKGLVGQVRERIDQHFKYGSDPNTKIIFSLENEIHESAGYPPQRLYPLSKREQKKFWRLYRQTK